MNPNTLFQPLPGRIHNPVPNGRPAHLPEHRKDGTAASLAAHRCNSNSHVAPMNPSIHRTRRHVVALAAALVALGAVPAGAAPFLYTPGELVLTLRQTGNAADLVVNIGTAASLSTLPSGTTVEITRLTADLLNQTFPSLNNLSFIVSGANRPPLVESFPIQTLWVTAPRLSPDLPATPWLRKGSAVQGNAGSQIDAIGRTAVSYSSLTPAGPANTATAVAIPLTSPFTLGPIIGASSDLVGNFQGSIAQLTADDFDSDSDNAAVSDLFELLPGTTAAGTLNQPGRLLGSFTFKPDGTLTFTSGATVTPAPQPQISSIQREGDVAIIAFGTVTGATYRLRTTGIGGLTSPINTWETGASVVGTGSTATLQDTSTSDVRFYAVEVVR
jgi:hypothetical protein